MTEENYSAALRISCPKINAGQKPPIGPHPTAQGMLLMCLDAINSDCENECCMLYHGQLFGAVQEPGNCICEILQCECLDEDEAGGIPGQVFPTPGQPGPATAVNPPPPGPIAEGDGLAARVAKGGWTGGMPGIRQVVKEDFGSFGAGVFDNFVEGAFGGEQQQAVNPSDRDDDEVEYEVFDGGTGPMGRKKSDDDDEDEPITFV